MNHEQSKRITFLTTSENYYMVAVDGLTGDPMAYRIDKNPREMLISMIKHGAKLYKSRSYPKVPAFFKDLEQAMIFAEEFVFPAVMMQDFAGVKPKTY